MHILVLVLLAFGGLSFLGAAIARWRHLGESPDSRQSHSWVVYAGLIALTLSLLIALFTQMDPGFTYAILGSWSAVASLLFLSRFLTAPSMSLLSLPIGATVLVVAMSMGLFGEFAEKPDIGHPIIWAHIIFMTVYLGGMLVTGAASGLYLVAARQLKDATSRALRLPSLPELHMVSYRGLVITSAMLLGGIATGGAAWGGGDWTVLIRPAPLLSLLSMVIMIIALGLQAGQRLGRRSLATFNIVLTALAVASTVGLVVFAHG